MRIKRIIFLFLIQLCMASNICTAEGIFSSSPELRFSDDGRTMILLKDFSFKDKNNELWLVPAGAVTDGASIPKFAWSIIGGPYEGKYRKSAIIHDFYCDKRVKPWEKVHRMFFEAMLSEKLDVRKAKLMYYIVYQFGPRWNEQTIANNNIALGIKVEKVARISKLIGSNYFKYKISKPLNASEQIKLFEKILNEKPEIDLKEIELEGNIIMGIREEIYINSTESNVNNIKEKYEKKILEN